MKLKPTLVLLATAAMATFSGCSRKDQSAPAPLGQLAASKPGTETVALAKAAPGKPGTSAACASCENTPSTCAAYTSCDSATGNAADGTPQSQLCKETLDCVRDSGCANDGKPPLKFCYCGTANVADCAAGKANGPCKAVLERGLEANTFAQIAGRIGKVRLGAGLAMKRIDCEQVFCRKQCF